MTFSTAVSYRNSPANQMNQSMNPANDVRHIDTATSRFATVANASATAHIPSRILMAAIGGEV